MCKNYQIEGSLTPMVQTPTSEVNIHLHHPETPFCFTKGARDQDPYWWSSFRENWDSSS